MKVILDKNKSFKDYWQKVKAFFAKAWACWKKISSSLYFKAVSVIFHFLVVPGVVNWCMNEFFLEISPHRDIQMASAYLFSYILVILFNALLTAITTSSVAANTILSLAGYIFSVCQHVKIRMTDNPVFFSDLNFIRSAGTLNDLVAEVSIWDMITEVTDTIVKFGIITAVIMVLGVILSFRLKYKWAGISVGGVALAALTFFIAPIEPFNDFTLNTFYEYDQRASDYPTTSIKYYYRFGVVSGMYGQAVESRIYAPDGYDSSNIKDILGNASANSNDEFKGAWGDCNIIMVFNESFWDIQQVGGFKFNTPTGTSLTPNYDKLSEEGHVFNMISPSFGGLSANPEFEMMTSSNLSLYAPGFVPYTQMYNDKTFEGTPNFMHSLKDGGYYNKIIDSWEDTLFDAKKVYSFFGVDNVIYRYNGLKVSNNQMLAGRPSDRFLADQIISFIESDEWKDRENFFVMTLTGQLHGSYYQSKYPAHYYCVNITDVPEAYKENSEQIIGSVKCFAQGLYDADRMLGKLYDYINTLDEKTIIIFYGDHLPNVRGIEAESNGDRNTIYDLDYFNTDDDVLNSYRRYDTECLIVGNFDLGEQDVEWLNYDLIMPYVLHRIDLPEGYVFNEYYDFLYEQRKLFPASNSYVAADKEGNLYSIFDLPEELQKQYDLRKQVNYWYFHDSKNERE